MVPVMMPAEAMRRPAYIPGRASISFRTLRPCTMPAMPRNPPIPQLEASTMLMMPSTMASVAWGWLVGTAPYGL